MFTCKAAASAHIHRVIWFYVLDETAQHSKQARNVSVKNTQEMSVSRTHVKCQEHTRNVKCQEHTRNVKCQEHIRNVKCQQHTRNVSVNNTLKNAAVKVRCNQKSAKKDSSVYYHTLLLFINNERANWPLTKLYKNTKVQQNTMTHKWHTRRVSDLNKIQTTVPY